ncbi:type III PLP-dependent enzyme [Sedimentimonas flavescens]|uniref:type III PLP-dependent enzyme n=1 Tax=Sedimentimonas flavescens TaxID=2851012 RepID=UPI0021A2B909|nr:type III PLP-dependent enzyme [Sedimentimonas flavescens]MCT2540534.1 type III PLP-dependent enzyme [Sedimentimonas flavescens]WBL33494.1 type III PLP-dependent enzyme [Sinirhodobacter sp. HNIBRBA609]
MGLSNTIWANPAEVIRLKRPDHPVLVFAPAALQATARRFIKGFPGVVTYAVKSNPDEMVIQNLAAAGVTGFDVASPWEIDLVRRLAPGAALHYHNPVRGRDEIAHAVAAGVKTWSVDSVSELDKLIGMVPTDGCEISVRFKLPVEGAAYNFGAKFGATAEVAAVLLRRAAAAGFIPSLTFHPGTQCTDPMAWDTYIRAAATICAEAGVKAHRLNVGGGFPSHRQQALAPALEDIFALIDRVATEAFGADRPILVCEPGRGMVAESFSLIARVKALRDEAHVFLNDGVYGNLTEMPQIGNIDRVSVHAPDGRPRMAAPIRRVVFGPTCDSLDRLPGELPLPGDLAEGDYLVFKGMGAYSTATNTRFNGFGQCEIETALSLVG